MIPEVLQELIGMNWNEVIPQKKETGMNVDEW